MNIVSASVIFFQSLFICSLLILTNRHLFAFLR
jgi:hypothetical protein